jgi:hypothetical protein
MTDLEYKMGQLVERIDGLINRMDRDDTVRRQREEDEAEKRDELEVRIRSLEDSRTQAHTTFGVLGAVATLVGGLLGWVLSLLTK